MLVIPTDSLNYSQTEQQNPYRSPGHTCTFASCCGSFITDQEDLFVGQQQGVSIGYFPADKVFDDIDAIIPVGTEGMAIHIRLNPKTKPKYKTDHPAFARDKFGDYLSSAYDIRRDMEHSPQKILPGVRSVYLTGWVTASCRSSWNSPHVLLDYRPTMFNNKTDIMLVIHTPEQEGLFEDFDKACGRKKLFSSKHYSYNNNSRDPGRLWLTVYAPEV